MILLCFIHFYRYEILINLITKKGTKYRPDYYIRTLYDTHLYDTYMGHCRSKNKHRVKIDKAVID